MLRKAILGALADFADDKGEGIFASIALLADVAGCGRTAIHEIIPDLESDGLIRRTGQRPCRGGHTVIWAINVDALLSLPDVEGVRTANSKGTESCSHCEQPTTPQCEQVPPKGVRTANGRCSHYEDGSNQEPIKLESPADSSGRDAKSFVAEIRRVMSPTGNHRTKPRDCEKLLPPLLKAHGFDALLAAARTFYRSTELQRDSGQFQCGLQVALRDGRIEALIEDPTAKAVERAKWVKRLAQGAIENWSAELAERYGPAPSQQEITAVQQEQ